MKESISELKADILKVFAQATRLEILEYLRGGEKSIHEIIATVHGGQSNISRHISLMQKNYIVTTRKDRVRVMVKVKDPEIFSILDGVNQFLKSQLEEQEELLTKV